MTAPAIRIEHLVKTYPAGSGQTKRAVNDATFDIPAGQIVSFLGPNGAGKTTTLRMILGLARPTSGSVQILGHDATKAANAHPTTDRIPARCPRFPGLDDRPGVPPLRRISVRDRQDDAESPHRFPAGPWPG